MKKIPKFIHDKGIDLNITMNSTNNQDNSMITPQKKAETNNMDRMDKSLKTEKKRLPTPYKGFTSIENDRTIKKFSMNVNSNNSNDSINNLNIKSITYDNDEEQQKYLQDEILKLEKHLTCEKKIR